MKIWIETNNPRIEPPERKQMLGIPPRNRRKSKDEPRKKYEKMSKQGVKITCFQCKQPDHNKKYCKVKQFIICLCLFKNLVEYYEHTLSVIFRLVSILHNQPAIIHNLLLVKVHKEVATLNKTSSNQPGPTTSNNRASSTAVCSDKRKCKNKPTTTNWGYKYTCYKRNN